MAELRWRKNVGPAEIVKLSVGPMDNNVYFIHVGDESMVVDAGSNEADAVFEELGDRKLVRILQTHGHGDHVIAMKEVKERSKAPVSVHKGDQGDIPVETELVDDGDVIKHGPVSFEVVHTPGHTPGGVCFILREGGETHVFAGDTLFPGGPGATNNNAELFAQVMNSLDTKLFTLPDDANIYPGHGSDTTIGAERPHVEEWRERGF